ncbi:MAG: histidine--tRNA ligase [Gammaproteobacteria bacterium]
MSKSVAPVKGIPDLLPDGIADWHRVEAVFRDVLGRYGYREIRLPLLERTELFKRSIGDTTDIVEKEMFTFDTQGGTSVTLRPEGTAGCVRAGISNGLLHNQRQRLWYTGPMYRNEKPQAGRYRQFYQFGAEAFGFGGPDIDAEMILMLARIWRELGLERVSLKINTLGDKESRARYRDELVTYFGSHEAALDDDSRRRLGSNPLRILDSKNPDLAKIIAGAPTLLDHLDDESAAHFAGLKDRLDAADIAYDVETRLVRGLDYYSRTVFEWQTDALGAQNAICGGGRYDSLVQHMGGRATPALGFGVGLDRLVALLAACNATIPPPTPDVYVVSVGERAAGAAQTLAERLRDVGSMIVVCHGNEGSFKSQLRAADKSGAGVALILGEDETQRGVAGLKPMRGGEQREVAFDELPAILARMVAQ